MENEPDCKLDIGFPDDQIIYITEKYKKETFCSYETELLPSKNNSSKKEYVIRGKYVNIVVSSLFVGCILMIVLIMIVINRKRKIEIDDLNNEKLLINQFN